MKTVVLTQQLEKSDKEKTVIIERYNKELDEKTAKVEELNESSHYWWCTAEQYKKELDEKTAKVEELNESSHYWWCTAERYKKELDAVHRSISWLVTWPLRKLLQFVLWSFNLPITLIIWITHIPKRIAQWLMVKSISFVLHWPTLEIRAMRWFNNHQTLKKYLRQLALTKGLIKDTVSPSIEQVEENQKIVQPMEIQHKSIPLDDVLVAENVEKPSEIAQEAFFLPDVLIKNNINLSDLSLSACLIYKKLILAIKEQQERNKQ